MSRLPRPGALGDRQGFNVIELLVALTILGVGILGLANLFPLGSQSQMRDRLKTSAVDLAQQKMEQLHMATWTGPEFTDGDHPTAAGEDLVMPNEGTFIRLWTVETQPGAFAEIKKVTVQVTWTFLQADTVRLVSYFQR